MTRVLAVAEKNIRNVMGNNMRSTCPSCLSQVEHSHSDNQVVCASCGESFSPFLARNDVASTEVSPPMETEFSESTLAFKEIIDFGQAVNQEVVKGPAPSNRSVSESTVSSSFQTEETFICSTTALSPEYRITQWLPPVSKMVVVGEDPSPLQKGIQELTESARSVGANALLGIRCTLAPDNKRALLLGTPVRCEKVR